MNKKSNLRVALLCGGPSLERGISLNSARSVLDHLDGKGIEIVPVYFDHRRKPYAISKAQLYSNTPSDFDFKLQQTAKALSVSALKNLLKSCDLAFPAMHGTFGEDGGIQTVLEKLKVPYVGSPAPACKICFDKYEANEFIRSLGFFAPPSRVLKIYHNDHEEILKSFFKENKLKRAIVKPATGGSSIGVFSVNSWQEALEKVRLLFSKRMDTRVVVEPFCDGIEFTVIVLQNRFGLPVAVLPSEIEVEYTENQIFDFRKKYLPSRQVRYHCPPRFGMEIIEKIQAQAEQLFMALGMRDFARFDGWVLPDGNLWFSDFNPISGMEQNSFLFQQAARIGMSHADVLSFIVGRVCDRSGLHRPSFENEAVKRKKIPVHVLFGGKTSERQVSLMSGTNAWLKLAKSKKYEPEAFLLDLKDQVWRVPYALMLNHTVEEILENCENAMKDEKYLMALEEKVRLKLAAKSHEISQRFFLPEKMSLEEFLKKSERILIALHGGIGEDGTLQKMLDSKKIKYNGSGAKTSALCMDKFETGKALEGLEAEGIFVAPKILMKLEKYKPSGANELWAELKDKLKAKSFIAKPRSEGCSSGIVRLFCAEDVNAYLNLLKNRAAFIPKGTFKNQNEAVDLPLEALDEILFEPFVETDYVRVRANRLKWKHVSGWVEITVALLEEAGKLRSLNPSLTVSEGEVLSVEEKFQGGTGVNMTPPPLEFISMNVLEAVKKRIKKVGEILGIQGYARVDAFMNIKSGEIIVIEVNTMPALTPSTVLYHQALAEENPIWPSELLELLLENKK